ncbi:MAG: rhodanese-like domain-containing protein [Pseudobdellovibrio sp.]
MEIKNYQDYLIPLLIIIFFAWRFFKYKKIKSLIPVYLEQGAIVIDVRTPEEFKKGSRPGSLNIPLSEIYSSLSKLDKEKTIILCCASGTRSGMAAGILKKHGFKKILNAGSWMNTLTK